MKNFTFMNSKETLKETLLSLSPPFVTVNQYLTNHIVKRLSPAEKAYFENSFIIKNQTIIESDIVEPPKNIEELLEEVIKEILLELLKTKSKALYAQCAGQIYKDFKVKMKTFNFGRTIIQTSSGFKTLFAVMPYKDFYDLLLNTTMIVPYKDEYFQVTGKLLNERFNMKALGGRKGVELITIPIVENTQKAHRQESPENLNNKQRQVDQNGNKIKSKKPNELNSRLRSQSGQKKVKTHNHNINSPLSPQSSDLRFKDPSVIPHADLSGSKEANIASILPKETNTFSNNKGINSYYVYSNQNLNRFQMFYCSSMNKNPGFYCNNIFFDKGMYKSSFINETVQLVNKAVKVHFMKKVPFNKVTQDKIYYFLQQIFQQIRDIMHLYSYNGKMTSKFNLMLSYHCRLPAQYRQLKNQVKEYQSGKIKDGTKLFDDLYAQNTPYESVTSLVKEIIKLSVPQKFIGPKNKQVLMNMMYYFIAMKRYQNYKMSDFLDKMDVFDMKWQLDKYNKKYHNQIIVRKRKLLSLIIAFVINQIIVPIIKFNFYVTEKHKEANKIFYYRKPIWIYISKTALKKFGEENLESIQRRQAIKLKKNPTTMKPEGKLRILPKKGTFRPIITFNRKLTFSSDINPTIKLRATLNQILADTQLVLRNLKNILGQSFGYCIFDNRQIMKKYDSFVKRWRQKGSPPLKYFTLDIHKCYDSINTSQLIKYIEQSKDIENQYLIVKYNRIYRNKKPLFGNNAFTGYFNFKERATAVPMADDPIEIKEELKIPAINIYPAKQKLITKDVIIEKLKKICEGSVVYYGKNYWLQKLGIPQGLNVSGVLCSLYFACLEKKYVHVNQGLLMRLTDDYFYIGPEKEAVTVLDSLLKCATNNNFKFSQQKISKNFHHKVLKNMNEAKEIVWIGKRINVQTLQMFPNFQMSDKIGYAMNVNLNKTKLKGFLKNKLKSLLTNHFASYFKPNLFPFSNQASIVRLYTEISLEKFYPFLQQLIRQKIQNEQQLMLKIFKSCFHEFVLFSCMLAQKIDDKFYYNKLYIQVACEFVKFCDRKKLAELKGIRAIFAADIERLQMYCYQKEAYEEGQ